MCGTQHRLLDRDDILKISYSGRKAAVTQRTHLESLALEELESVICTLDNRHYVQNNFEYRLSLAILLSYVASPPPA